MSGTEKALQAVTDDALNRPQVLKPVQDLKIPPIPAFEEHEREVKRLWRQCRWMALGIFVFCVALGLVLSAFGVDPERAVAISTYAFQAILLSYGMGFFVPAFLTSLKRLGLSVHMMYEGLRLNRESARDMKEAANDMRRVRERVERDSNPLPINRREVLEEVEEIDAKPNGEE